MSTHAASAPEPYVSNAGGYTLPREVPILGVTVGHIMHARHAGIRILKSFVATIPHMHFPRHMVIVDGDRRSFKATSASVVQQFIADLALTRSAHLRTIPQSKKYRV